MSGFNIAISTPTSIPMLIVTGEGIADDSFNYQNEHTRSPSLSAQSTCSESPSFAPQIASASANSSRRLKRFRQSLQLRIPQQGNLFNAHTAWSVRHSSYTPTLLFCTTRTNTNPLGVASSQVPHRRRRECPVPRALPLCHCSIPATKRVSGSWFTTHGSSR